MLISDIWYDHQPATFVILKESHGQPTENEELLPEHFVCLFNRRERKDLLCESVCFATPCQNCSNFVYQFLLYNAAKSYSIEPGCLELEQLHSSYPKSYKKTFKVPMHPVGLVCVSSLA